MNCVAGCGLPGWFASCRKVATIALLAGAVIAFAEDPARSTVPEGSRFGLPQTQLPLPSADSFQSFQGFQGRAAAWMGAGSPAGGFGGYGGGIQVKDRFGIQSTGSIGAGAPPNFNQMMRANVALPFHSSIGTLKLSYRDMLGPGANGAAGSFAPGTAGVMFSTTSLGNGIFFSAGTNFGKGSMAGAPPGGFGRGTGSAAPKSPGPAVTLKLSF